MDEVGGAAEAAAALPEGQEPPPAADEGQQPPEGQEGALEGEAGQDVGQWYGEHAEVAHEGTGYDGHAEIAEGHADESGYIGLDDHQAHVDGGDQARPRNPPCGLPGDRPKTCSWWLLSVLRIAETTAEQCQRSLLLRSARKRGHSSHSVKTASSFLFAVGGGCRG